MAFRRGKLTLFLVIAEVVFIILFGLFADYDTSDANPEHVSGGEDKYPMFQDVHVMMFIGFGFLMTFLKKYGYSSVGVNMLIAVFVLQWATIIRGLLEAKGETFHITIIHLMSADFAAATVLISFGGVLGKTSPLQLLVMALFEVVFSQINEHIGFEYLKVADVGESMFVHIFGAYFGLAVTRMLYNKDCVDNKNEGSSYISDIFSFVGTVFLWLYWPSFNGGAVTGDLRSRAIVNTYFSMCACAMMTFAISSLLDKKAKFDAVHIQNATLAGGVAIGTCAHMPLGLYAPLIVGSVAAFVSVIGYKYISPFLCSKLKIHDTCGIHNLHGLPGVVAAIAGVIAAAVASCSNYKNSLFEIFDARLPEMNITYIDVCKAVEDGKLDYARSAGGQAAYQLLALGMTLGIAIVGGLITGAIMRMPIWDNPKPNTYFDDEDRWALPENGYMMQHAEVTGNDDQHKM